MIIIKKISLLILLSILFTSCLLDDTTDIALPFEAPKMFVECQLEQGERHTLRLLDANRFNDQIGLNLIYNAEVSIYTQDSFRLANIVNFSSDGDPIYNYVNTANVSSKEDSVFLSIKTRDGAMLRASSSVLEDIEIQNVDVSDKFITVTSSNDFEPNHKYYALSINKYQADSLYGGTATEFFDFSRVDSNVVTLRINRGPAECDSMRVELAHINKAHYDYQVTSKDARAANVDPSVAPTMISSNIKGGLGIFTHYTTDRVTIVCD